MTIAKDEIKQKEITIRTRKSYKMYKKFFKAGCGKAVLELLHEELDNRSSYGSIKASNYSRESLDLFIKDHGA
jgi:hypothetical protein